VRAARAVTDILVSVLFGAAASGGFLPCGVRQSCQPPLAVLSDLSHCEAGGSVMPKAMAAAAAPRKPRCLVSEGVECLKVFDIISGPDR
jgi:hypothetical protein